MTLQERNSNQNNELENTEPNESNQSELNILTDQAKEIIRQQKGKRFGILLAGRTGVGKSSTINSLMDKKVAEVGDFEPTTITVEKFENEINGVPFTVYDSPGLCDDLAEEKKDYKYINEMVEKIEEFHSLWFVARLDETRVSRDEKVGIQLITKAFKKEVWEKAVIVFTYADKISSEKYPRYVAERTRLIRQEIAKYTNEDVAENIPSVAVDNTKETTPDGKTWLNKLFINTYTTMLKEGALPFVLSLINRIEPPEPEVRYEYRTRTVYRPAPESPSKQLKEKKEPNREETNPSKKIVFDDDDSRKFEERTEEIFESYYQSGKLEGIKEYGSIGKISGGARGGARGGAKIGREIAGDAGEVAGAVGGWVVGGLRGAWDYLTRN